MGYAKNACVSNPDCGAVYEQACAHLEYDVAITNQNDLNLLTTAMITITIPPARVGDPVMTQQEIGASSLIGSTTLLKGSVYVNEFPKIVEFPFTMRLSVKPKYGAI